MAGDVFEVDGGMVLVRDEAAARSEARVEAVACLEAVDEAAASSGAGIKDGRLRRHSSL
jgi:hypothetical protein